MVNEQRLYEIISLIKKISQPDELYIFGSYANGTQKENSDLDIAVIKENLDNKMEESFQIRKQLFSNYFPIDLTYIKKTDMENKKNEFGTIYYEIATKGKKV